MATLVLLRHAKAEPHRNEDHSRQLSEKGRAQCATVREWLQDKGIEPDRVVVSSSARTRETWELAGVGAAEPEYEDRVYEASVQDLRDVVAETKDDIRTLVLVGHNPVFEELAWELDDSQDARDLTNQGMRTAGVAVFDLPEWSASSGTLTGWF